MRTPQPPNREPLRPPDQPPDGSPDEGRGTTRRAPSSRPGAPGIWSPAYRLLTAGLLLTIVSFAFEAMAVATALPATLRELGGLPLYGWAFSAMQLATLLGTVLGGPLAVAGVALVALTLPRLLPAGTVLARRGLPAAIATSGLLCFGFFGAEAFLPLALVTVHGLSVSMAGLVLGGAALTWASGSWLQARLTAAGRRGTLVLAGAAIVAVAVGGASTATIAAVPPLVTAVAWAVGGAGMGLGFSTLSLVVLEAAEPGHEGGLASGLQLGQTLGAAVGTGAGGALVALSSAAGWSPAAGIRLVDGLALTVAALAVLTGARTPRRAVQATDTATPGRRAA